MWLFLWPLMYPCLTHSIVTHLYNCCCFLSILIIPLRLNNLSLVHVCSYFLLSWFTQSVCLTCCNVSHHFLLPFFPRPILPVPSGNGSSFPWPLCSLDPCVPLVSPLPFPPLLPPLSLLPSLSILPPLSLLPPLPLFVSCSNHSSLCLSNRICINLVQQSPILTYCTNPLSFSLPIHLSICELSTYMYSVYQQSRAATCIIPSSTDPSVCLSGCLSVCYPHPLYTNNPSSLSASTLHPQTCLSVIHILCIPTISCPSASSLHPPTPLSVCLISIHSLPPSPIPCPFVYRSLCLFVIVFALLLSSWWFYLIQTHSS